EQRVQVGGQIDIHVGEHLAGTNQPDRPQRPATTKLLQPDDADTVEPNSQAADNNPDGVGTAVVGDGNMPNKRETAGQIAVQPANTESQIDLLILDQNDDIHLTDARRSAQVGRCCCR